MAAPRSLQFDTLSLHAGQRPDPVTGARAVPILLHHVLRVPRRGPCAALFNMERGGTSTRASPSHQRGWLEERVAALEAAWDDRDRERRQAACISRLRRSRAQARNIVASPHSTAAPTICSPIRCRARIETSSSPRAILQLEKAIRPNTKLLSVRRSAIRPGRARHLRGRRDRARSEAAPAGGLPRSHALPAETFDHGATSSTIRPQVPRRPRRGDRGCWWMGARSTGKPSGKFPELSEPYAASTEWISRRSPRSPAFLLRAGRREGLRDFGACMSPASAFQILQGIETLPLRMERHVENTRKVIASSQRGLGGMIAYPELPAHPDPRPREAASPARLRRGLQLRLEGRRDAGRRFIGALKSSRTSPTSAMRKSLVIHPASTRTSA